MSRLDYYKNLKKTSHHYLGILVEKMGEAKLPINEEYVKEMNKNHKCESSEQPDIVRAARLIEGEIELQMLGKEDIVSHAVELCLIKESEAVKLYDHYKLRFELSN